ncbi:MAG: wax ester/triacylglycerol synthase family O-acyltransferase [Pseudomonadales bacterium]|nr:wax ester/triacylglycerol synthase family O-acyltransferase [Pseudomonadales bacterium]
MQQLSAQDASFLYLESPHAPMHIGGIMIYDPSTVEGGRQRFKDILGFVEDRLHLARTFRQKLVQVPFNLDHPYWIEDKDFDLEYHVRHIRLPDPGDWRQLCIQVARLHARPLDLTKPLWEFTVIEGVDAIPGLPAGSYAIVSKVHHAAIDGVSGVDLIEALHGLEPYPEHVPPPTRPWTGEVAPNPLELMARAQFKALTQPLRFAEMLARGVPAFGRMTEGFAMRQVQPPATVPPRTRFNRTVSAHRVVEARQFPLSEVREIKGRVDGATVNDVVLAICGGALRHYLEAKRELPDASLIAMAPVSVRSSGEKGALGNQVSGMLVSLGTDQAEPLGRLAAVRASSASSKALSNAVGARLLTDYSQFIPSTTAAMAARLYTELGLANQMNLPFNCVVTNVPGPQVPLYSAGARLVTQYGLGPVYDGMGLMFPVFSYCGHINVAVSACREMMPDPEFFAACLQESFEELRASRVPA